MLKDTIFIEKPLEETWEIFNYEFAKVFKCSPKKIKGRTIKTQVKAMNGKTVDITQEVIIYEPLSHFAFSSTNPKDYVETHYEFLSDEDGTFVTSYDVSAGGKIYTKLPILKQKSKKKLRSRLEAIKYMVENAETK